MRGKEQRIRWELHVWVHFCLRGEDNLYSIQAAIANNCMKLCLFRHGLCFIELEDAYTVSSHLLTGCYCKQMTADAHMKRCCKAPICEKILFAATFDSISDKPFAVKVSSPLNY